MATTGIVSGNLMQLYLNGNPIGCTTTAAFSFSRAVTEAICKDNNGARQISPGGLSGTFTTSGLWKFDAAYGVEDISTLFLAGTSLTVRWTTNVAGDFYFQADCYCTELSGAAAVNDNVTFDATFTIDGDITKGDET